MNRIAIDMTGANTAASLFGVHRRIAYENRKYHCGCVLVLLKGVLW